MHLRLIRHGQSVANQEQRLQGQLDYPLSEQGEQQARLIGQWLANEKIDAIYASDLSRAWHTAEAIAHYHALDITTREDIREVQLGRFQGLTRAQIEQQYPHYARHHLTSLNLPDVETEAQLRQRAMSVVDSLLANHYGEQIVVVSHGGWIHALLMGMLDAEEQPQRIFSIANTSMTTVDFGPEHHFKILGVNETPHLQVEQPTTQRKNRMI